MLDFAILIITVLPIPSSLIGCCTNVIQFQSNAMVINILSNQIRLEDIWPQDLTANHGKMWWTGKSIKSELIWGSGLRANYWGSHSSCLKLYEVGWSGILKGLEATNFDLICMHTDNEWDHSKQCKLLIILELVLGQGPPHLCFWSISTWLMKSISDFPWPCTASWGTP